MQCVLNACEIKMLQRTGEKRCTLMRLAKLKSPIIFGLVACSRVSHWGGERLSRLVDLNSNFGAKYNFLLFHFINNNSNAINASTPVDFFLSF